MILWKREYIQIKSPKVTPWHQINHLCKLKQCFFSLKKKQILKTIVFHIYINIFYYKINKLMREIFLPNNLDTKNESSFMIKAEHICSPPSIRYICIFQELCKMPNLAVPSSLRKACNIWSTHRVVLCALVDYTGRDAQHQNNKMDVIFVVASIWFNSFYEQCRTILHVELNHQFMPDG